MGRKDNISKAEIMYTRDYTFTHRVMALNIPGIEKLPGFPIVVRLESTDGLTVFYTVSKIDTTTQFAPRYSPLPTTIS